MRPVFTCGDYQVYKMPETQMYNIYHVIDKNVELMADNFERLADAIKYIMHP